jgi:hypothetical protein
LLTLFDEEGGILLGLREAYIRLTQHSFTGAKVEIGNTIPDKNGFRGD